MEAAASTPSTPLGVAKLADRTMHKFLRAQTYPIATPTRRPKDNRLALVCQSDGECLLHRDERNSTAEQEQLSKPFGHKWEAVSEAEHNGHALP